MTTTNPYSTSNSSIPSASVPTPPASPTRILIGRVGFVAGLLLILLFGKLNMMFTVGQGGSLSDYVLVLLLCLGLPGMLIAILAAKAIWKIQSTPKENARNEVIADASVVWLLEPWIGWVYFDDKIQVGVVNGKTYHKSGLFFADGSKATSKKVFSKRAISVNTTILVNTIDNARVELILNANCFVKPQKAAQVLGTLHFTEMQITSEVIATLSSFAQRKPLDFIIQQKMVFEEQLLDYYAEKIPYLKIQILDISPESKHNRRRVILETELDMIKAQAQAQLQIETEAQKQLIDIYIKNIQRQEMLADRDPSRAVLNAYAEIKSIGVDAFLREKQGKGNVIDNGSRKLNPIPQPKENQFETGLVRAAALSEFRLVQHKPPYTLSYLGYRVTLSPSVPEPGMMEVVIYDPDNRKSKPVKRSQDDLGPLLVELQGVIQTLNTRRNGT